jgi:chemotaxis protein MotC
MKKLSAGSEPFPTIRARARFVSILVIQLVSGLCILSAVSCLAAQSRPPYEILRSMLALQDQIALGNTAALEALPGLSAQLAEKMIAADPAMWREPRNSRAAVVYVLSGGQPRVLQKVLAGGVYPIDDKKLMEGTLAYVEGHEAKARQILSEIDPRSLEAIVGGHVALAQGSLLAHSDPHKAIDLLDLAILLAPGTLVEEAALRREVFLAEQVGDFSKFSSSAGQYLRRFSKSGYSENFRKRFSATLIDIAVAGRLDQIMQLEKFFDEMSDAEQLQLYFIIAQSALANGKLDTARYASTRALQLTPHDSADATRAALYDGVVSVLARDCDLGLGVLDKLDRSKLTRRDASLADGALALAWEIRHWPEASRSLRQQDGSTIAPPPGFDQTLVGTDGAIDLARQALAATDEALKGKSQ